MMFGFKTSRIFQKVKRWQEHKPHLQRKLWAVRGMWHYKRICCARAFFMTTISEYIMRAEHRAVRRLCVVLAASVRGLGGMVFRTLLFRPILLGAPFSALSHALALPI